MPSALPGVSPQVKQSSVCESFQVYVHEHPLISSVSALFFSTLSATTLVQARAVVTGTFYGLLALGTVYAIASPTAAIEADRLSETEVNGFFDRASAQASGLVEGVKKGVVERDVVGQTWVKAQAVGAVALSLFGVTCYLGASLSSFLWGTTSLYVASLLKPSWLTLQAPLNLPTRPTHDGVSPSVRGESLHERAYTVGQCVGSLAQPIYGGVANLAHNAADFIVKCTAK